MENEIKILYDKDDKEAYHKLIELESISTESDELYDYFNYFEKMLDDDKSYIRVRGFRMICSLSQWDKDNKINKIIDKLLLELNDEKPTAVRQCLKALHLVLLYKPELSDSIEEKLRSIDVNKYKDSMSPLIEKDVNELLKNI